MMVSFLKALNLIDGTSRSWIKAGPIKDDQSAPNPRLNKQKQTLCFKGILQINFYSYAPSDDGQFLKGTQFDRWDIEVMDQSCP